MHRALRSALIVAFLAPLALSAACEEAAEPACVATLCTPGQSRCDGNYVLSCDTAGTAWTVQPCGANGACVASGGGAQCQSAKCVPGAQACDANGDLQICSPTGLSFESRACPGTGSCLVGPAGNARECLGKSCENGEKRCGDGVKLLCGGDVWNPVDCAAGEVCELLAGEPTCVPGPCDDAGLIPGQARCEGDAAWACSASGRALTKQTCGSNEVCKAGFCVAKVCGLDTPAAGGTSDATGSDAVSTDTSASDGSGGADGTTVDAGPTKPDVFVPPLEQIPVITFELGGIPQTFDFNARADYVNTDKRLKISGQKSLRKLEINIDNVEPLDVGTWDDTDATAVVVTFCYYDGVTETFLAVEGCGGEAGGFTHASVLYGLTLDKNNGKDQWVEGTFEATLVNAAEEPITLSSGVIKVIHK